MESLNVDNYEIVHDQPDNNRDLDTKPLHSLIEVIESTSSVSLEKIAPTMVAIPTIFSHHQDHVHVHHACIAEGETIFVNGGSGAVGIAVVQIAKALGARVIASAGTPKKRKMVEDYGADVVVDYHDPAQVLKSVRQFAPHGVDVFWETSREPDFHMAISIICERGRIVLMAGRDAQPSFPVGPFSDSISVILSCIV